MPSGRRNAAPSSLEEDPNNYTLHCTAETTCRDELSTDQQSHTVRLLLTTDGKSAKTVFPQKHTAYRMGREVAKNMARQYRRRTGKDIKYVQCAQYIYSSVHTNMVGSTDIKHRKTENSQRNFHGQGGRGRGHTYSLLAFMSFQSIAIFVKRLHSKREVILKRQQFLLRIYQFWLVKLLLKRNAFKNNFYACLTKFNYWTLAASSFCRKFCQF